MPLENPTGTIANFSSGSVFPSSPSTGQVFFRTDHAIQYFYNGTFWLSTHLMALPLPAFSALPSTALAATSSNQCLAVLPVSPTNSIWVENFVTSISPTGTQDGTNHWQIKVSLADASVLGTLDTNGLSAGEQRIVTDVSIGVAISTTTRYFLLSATKIATPGNITLENVVVNYRIKGS
jgi:hypothetical protein